MYWGLGSTKYICLHISLSCLLDCVYARVSVYVLSGLRGETADICVLEEAAFIPAPVVGKIIAPLLGVKNTVVIGISTPASDGNYYSALLTKKKKDGSNVFRTIPIGLACQECVEIGKALTCPHKGDELPDWKPPDRQDIQKALMSDEQFKAETLGLIPGRADVAFERSDIAAMLKRPEQDVYAKGGTYVYIACDPTGGGGSRLALTAFVWAQGNSLESRVRTDVATRAFKEKLNQNQNQNQKSLSSTAEAALNASRADQSQTQESITISDSAHLVV